ncbi:unnamed protein product [Lathyrus sativus]|nr:unnamed protein product [Lathyrus sativus]
MANKYHIRSISLPSRSHPSTIRVTEELNKLKAWEVTSTSTSTSASILIALSLLEDLYISLEHLLNMPSTQQLISHHRGEKFIQEVLDSSMRILDVCASQGTLCCKSRKMFKPFILLLEEKKEIHVFKLVWRNTNSSQKK